MRLLEDRVNEQYLTASSDSAALAISRRGLTKWPRDHPERSKGESSSIGPMVDWTAMDVRNRCMGMRRFTRLTNAFSKKIENHTAAVTLQFMFHNFARPHRSLANPYPRTPAMAAGIADHIWTCEEIAALLD